MTSPFTVHLQRNNTATDAVYHISTHDQTSTTVSEWRMGCPYTPNTGQLMSLLRAGKLPACVCMASDNGPSHSTHSSRLTCYTWYTLSVAAGDTELPVVQLLHVVRYVLGRRPLWLYVLYEIMGSVVQERRQLGVVLTFSCTYLQNDIQSTASSSVPLTSSRM